MRPEGYYRNATISMLKAKPAEMTLRRFDFDAYEKPTLEQISLNLLTYRKVLGESQDSFANKIEISRPQYRKYEQGLDVVRLDVAHRISIKFGLPAFFLVTGSPYQALLNLPVKDSSFDKIWRYANSLSDHYFLKLCKNLENYIGCESPASISSLPGVTKLNYELALKENRAYIYIAMAESIKAIRQHYGYSQEQIAEFMGVALSTYREYEKPTQRPRFNLLVSIRWAASTGIHPFYALAGTEIIKVRELQNRRLDVLIELFSNITRSEVASLIPLVEGFYRTCASRKDALLLS